MSPAFMAGHFPMQHPNQHVVNFSLLSCATAEQRTHQPSRGFTAAGHFKSAQDCNIKACTQGSVFAIIN